MTDLEWHELWLRLADSINNRHPGEGLPRRLWNRWMAAIDRATEARWRHEDTIRGVTGQWGYKPTLVGRAP